MSFIIWLQTQNLECCCAGTSWNALCSVRFHKEGHDMHDPALWTSWYVVLLLFPFMIIVLLLSDYLAGRGRR